MLGRGVWLFLIISFAFSWAVAGVIYYVNNSDLELNQAAQAGVSAGLALIYMSGPMVGALICAWLFDKGRRGAALGWGFKFNIPLIWAWFIPVFVVLAAMVIDVAFSPAEFGVNEDFNQMLEQQGLGSSNDGPPPGMLIAFQVVIALTIGPAINMILTLTEELGWRGWLWDRWRPLGFWRGNLLIGLAWGVWHAPLIAQGHNYPGMPVWGPVIMTALMMVTSPLIGWVREAGGTVLHAGLYHGALNATAGIGIILVTQTDFPFMGYLGVGGFAVMLALWGVLAFVIRPGRDAGQAEKTA